MYGKVASAALPTTGLAAHFAGGLSYLYAGMIAFAAVGATVRGQADAAHAAHQLTRAPGPADPARAPTRRREGVT